MKPTLAILGIAIVVAACLAYAVGGSLFYSITAKPKAVAAKVEPAEICVGKVTYLKFEGGFLGSPAVVTKVRPDGKIWTCGGV